MSSSRRLVRTPTALKTGMAVLVSSNLPSSSPLLTVRPPSQRRVATPLTAPHNAHAPQGCCREAPTVAARKKARTALLRRSGDADCFIPTRAATLFVRVSHLSAGGTVYAHACVRSLAASRRRRRYEPCYEPGPSSTAAAAAARSSSCLGGRPQGCSMRCRQVYFCRPTLSFSASAM